ncbi:molybdate ABC transporter permease subunit, partial [Mobiluncus curtisii]|nr:molybdate ABC transporter permease subunit [Mobiluncus curtisii]
MNANNHGFPRWLYLPAGTALLLVVLPILGLMVRVPWIRLAEILTRDESRDALLLSLRTCLVSLVLVLILGTPLA